MLLDVIDTESEHLDVAQGGTGMLALA